MITNGFIAGFCSELWDGLAMYEVTKDVTDLLNFWEYTAPTFEPLRTLATIPTYPITDKENSLLRICELVQNAINTGFLSLSDKQTMSNHLDTLSENITL